MTTAISILTGVIALIHIYILWFEMFAWTTRGKRVFKSFPEQQFEQTKAMAANQGLYNGFLAAGLIWSLFITDAVWRDYISLFFLSCVAIAGIFGAVTAEKRIVFVQALPAFITILLIVIK
jgi:putative membrane protein